MNMRQFPFIRFGKCPVCGGGGDNDPNAVAPDVPYATVVARNAVAGRTVANGWVLRLFRGEPMCEMCIKEILADEESILMAEKFAETERFLQAAGFKKEV